MCFSGGILFVQLKTINFNETQKKIQQSRQFTVCMGCHVFVENAGILRCAIPRESFSKIT